ncbi:bifunctional protein CysNC [Anopheles sinensis]|uniref:Bifunctional protein CysNC n=1 Tax=Anopheles sinensis TaxID=74873 RepID=A0A084VU04_ANOSI|nr:bifunctional protein CysNC [Anopheles sinensis]
MSPARQGYPVLSHVFALILEPLCSFLKTRAFVDPGAAPGATGYKGDCIVSLVYDRPTKNNDYDEDDDNDDLYLRRRQSSVTGSLSSPLTDRPPNP